MANSIAVISFYHNRGASQTLAGYFWLAGSRSSRTMP
jgi:hypothetical protein